MSKLFDWYDKTVLTLVGGITIYALTTFGLRSCENKYTQLEHTNKIEIQSDSTKSKEIISSNKDSLDSIINYNLNNSTKHNSHTSKSKAHTHNISSNYALKKQNKTPQLHLDTIIIKHNIEAYNIDTQSENDSVEMIMEDVDNDELVDIIELKGDTLEIFHNTGAEFTEEIIIDTHIKRESNHSYHEGRGYINKDNKIDLLIKDVDLSGKEKPKIRYFRNETQNNQIKYAERKFRSKILTFKHNHGNKQIKNYFNVQKF